MVFKIVFSKHFFGANISCRLLKFIKISFNHSESCIRNSDNFCDLRMYIVLCGL